jgi:hypothetical protein
MSTRLRQDPRRLPGDRRRSSAVVAVWGLTVAITLLFAHVTAIGPVLLRLTSTHGVHLGDVAFALVAFAIAAMITHRLARPR